MLSRELGRHLGSLQLPPPFQPLLPCQPMRRAGLLQAREEVTCSARASPAGRAHCCLLLCSLPLLCALCLLHRNLCIPIQLSEFHWTLSNFSVTPYYCSCLKLGCESHRKLRKGGEEKKKPRTETAIAFISLFNPWRSVFPKKIILFKSCYWTLRRWHLRVTGILVIRVHLET